MMADALLIRCYGTKEHNIAGWPASSPVPNRFFECCATSSAERQSGLTSQEYRPLRSMMHTRRPWPCNVESTRTWGLSAAQLQLSLPQPRSSSRTSTAKVSAQASKGNRSKPISMSDLLRKEQQEQSTDFADQPVSEPPLTDPAARKPPASQNTSRTSYLHRLITRQRRTPGDDETADIEEAARPQLASTSSARWQSPHSGFSTRDEDVDDAPSSATSSAASSSPRGKSSRIPSRPVKRLAREDKRNDPAAAVEYSLFLLGRRMMTHAEVQQKLADKGYTEAAADKALNRLTELGEVNDERYAKLYIRSKWRNSQRGPQLLTMELQRKGVDLHVIKEAVAEFFKDNLKATWQPSMVAREDEELSAAQTPQLSSTFEFNFDMEDDENRDLLADLTSAARTRLNTMRNVPKEAQIRRLVGWLQRRGHSWDTVSIVLKMLKLK